MYLLYLDTIIGGKGGKLFFIFFSNAAATKEINAVTGILGKFVQCY